MTDPMSVRIYTTRVCPYCIAAKRLLSVRGIAYEEVDLTGDADGRERLARATGRKTVPQIFVRGEPIGGFTDLEALDRSGRLAEMLA